MKLAGNGKPRSHRGDIMSKETRSAVMSRIRGRDTGPERAVASWLLEMGLSPECHPRDIPGRPDFAFRTMKLAVFVDGDFWHGWRFPAWRHKLSEKWEAKIEKNRKRDIRNHARLRRMGWRVFRIWEHQLEKSPKSTRAKLERALAETASPPPSI